VHFVGRLTISRRGQGRSAGPPPVRALEREWCTTAGGKEVLPSTGEWYTTALESAYHHWRALCQYSRAVHHWRVVCYHCWRAVSSTGEWSAGTGEWCTTTGERCASTGGGSHHWRVVYHHWRASCHWRALCQK